MTQTETILERTDRILSAITGKNVLDGTAEPRPVRDMASLWSSGLGGALLFSVDDPQSDAAAEGEAQKIIARHVDRLLHQPVNASMSLLVEFQQALQMRSKVISAIEMLMRG